MTELIYGIHAVGAVLKTHPERVQRLYLPQGGLNARLAALKAQALSGPIAIEFLAKTQLDNLAEQGKHQGVIAQCLPERLAPAQVTDLATLLDQLTVPPFLLILDQVQDPHNLGACLRSADAAGVHAVIVPKDQTVGLTAVVRKVAVGAAERVPFIQVTNLARTLRELRERGIWLYGLAEEGATSIYAADLRGPVALVLGAEATGLRRLTREHCDALLAIPMAPGAVASLNVSVATGVSLFEAVRQRQGK